LLEPDCGTASASPSFFAYPQLFGNDVPRLARYSDMIPNFVGSFFRLQVSIDASSQRYGPRHPHGFEL